MTVTIQATLTRPISGQVWAFATLHVGIAGSGFVPGSPGTITSDVANPPPRTDANGNVSFVLPPSDSSSAFVVTMPKGDGRQFWIKGGLADGTYQLTDPAILLAVPGSPVVNIGISTGGGDFTATPTVLGVPVATTDDAAVYALIFGG